MNHRETAQALKKAMEFYGGLGFRYLPISEKKVSELLMNTAADDAPVDSGTEETIVSEADKDRALQELREEIGDCQRCKLCRGRTNIVFGEGSSHARLMFIGEGPGRDEDLQARPFVGEAGKLLTRLIEKMGMKREEVYIANIVKCRPPNNRDPEEDEISSCRPFVERQAQIISPDVIMSLGRVSAQSILGMKMPIGKLRGNFFSFNDIPLMPTYHPAYLLRNPKDKWLVWADAQKALSKLKNRG
ncbi:MAG: uracil-DNA glycosylase [Nitrospiraceae bacterium]|nr:MAG: uracil-DNA glycosylase [Nitrospiraceae bacterium]